MNEIDNLVKSLESMPTYSIVECLYSQSKESPVFHKKSAPSTYNELFSKLEEILFDSVKERSFKSAKDIPLTGLFSLAEMTVYLVPRAPEIVAEAMKPDHLDHFLPCHVLNVAILACKIAEQLKWSFNEKVELTVAALLHDIGTTAIDPQVHCHDRKLTEDEKKLMESHSQEGYQMLDSIKNEIPWLADVVLQEHKREDGTGYPQDFTGDTHKYAKVIGICDEFEALTHKRYHRKANHPADAMKTIIRSRGTKHQASLVKALIDALSLYPIGSFVILNNEKIAKVIKANPRNPLRPDVRVVGNSGEETTNYCLTTETNLHIAGIVYDDNYNSPQSS